MFGDERAFKRIEWGLRLSVPQILLLVFFILSFVTVSLPFFGQLRPHFLLMGLYYWAVYRPTIMPPVYCFVLGLLMDLITGLAPGIHAILFLLVRWIVVDQRRFLMGQPYIVTWIGFALICIGFYFGQWLFIGLSGLNWGNIMDLSPNLLVTVILYPFVTLLLILVHRVLPVASKSFS